MVGYMPGYISSAKHSENKNGKELHYFMHFDNFAYQRNEKQN